MPRGMGTYGTRRGRPPIKRKPRRKPVKKPRKMM